MKIYSAVVLRRHCFHLSRSYSLYSLFAYAFAFDALHVRIYSIQHNWNEHLNNTDNYGCKWFSFPSDFVKSKADSLLLVCMVYAVAFHHNKYFSNCCCCCCIVQVIIFSYSYHCEPGTCYMLKQMTRLIIFLPFEIVYVQVHIFFFACLLFALTLYISNEWSEGENDFVFPSTVCGKRIKYQHQTRFRNEIILSIVIDDAISFAVCCRCTCVRFEMLYLSVF